MKRLCIASIVAMTGCAHAAPAGDLQEPLKAPATLVVTSSDFNSGDTLGAAYAFNGFGCTGENRRPQLSWSGAPHGTKSYAVIAHDPDAPTGVGFFHWVVLDLPAETTSLASDVEPTPPAVIGRNDAGFNGYLGPCPPPGPKHRYIFTVYALDTPSVQLDTTASGALTRFVINSHVLAYGRTTALYGR